ncbi:NlpC/P60 family protein [Streptomyces sp. C8S0]|uniref:C40 family peptidase n=1 Tax=Streptomyces sp. C8S0 TaxID=2585716 RepID=UPI00299F689F|nr:NlpC/P60 family protein [Streptomyces sp. C8S0]
MLALYQRAAPECPGLSWTVLAAIGKVETDHARHPTMISSAGAVGPMQFLPSTFKQYAHPVPPGGKNPPTPWDPVDAVHAAARLLCAHGARNGRDLRRAIWHYNHSNAYVDHVLTVAAKYAASAPEPATAADKAVAFARAQIGTPYVWGGDGPAEGGFDCSGLTQAAYRAAGISIPASPKPSTTPAPRTAWRAPRTRRPAVLRPQPAQHHSRLPLHRQRQGRGRTTPGLVVREGAAKTHLATFQGATRPAARGGAR